MNLLIFMAILGEFQGLEYKDALPVCDKVFDFIIVEDRVRKFDWSYCNNDVNCSKLSDNADSYLDACEDMLQ